MKDSCYYSVKSRVSVFPSARASQQIAKCRKAHGHVRKGSSGSSLRRWNREKWVNVKTGRPCGDSDHYSYCRPSVKVSKSTPVVRGGRLDASRIREKASGQRASIRRRR